MLLTDLAPSGEESPLHIIVAFHNLLRRHVGDPITFANDLCFFTDGSSVEQRFITFLRRAGWSSIAMRFDNGDIFQNECVAAVSGSILGVLQNSGRAELWESLPL